MPRIYSTVEDEGLVREGRWTAGCEVDEVGGEEGEAWGEGKRGESSGGRREKAAVNYIEASRHSSKRRKFHFSCTVYSLSLPWGISQGQPLTCK